MSWTRPRIEDLTDVVSRAEHHLLVCSPFIKRSGLEIIQDFIKPNLREIEVWTRLSFRDWFQNASDPEALLDFIEDLPETTELRLRSSADLHAKFFVADDQVGMIGSANLSASAFTSNVEFVQLLSAGETPGFVEAVAAVRPLLDPSDTRALRQLVERCSEAADSRDAYLSLGLEEAPDEERPKRLAFSIKDFVDYCAARPSYLCNKALEIRTGQDVTNRTGHIVQAFYAVQRFFQEYPEHIRAVSRAPLDADFDPRAFGQASTDWKRFLDEFISEEAPGYSLTSIKKNLTQTFGGTRTGGGGWDPPFKIVWPIVARMMGPSRSD